MKAIIELDVPDWQIGQEVSIYFPDTMNIKATVQEDKRKTGIQEKIANAESVDLFSSYFSDKEIEKIIEDAKRNAREFLNQSDSIPESCRYCPNHPINGGSGICHCILGTPSAMC